MPELRRDPLTERWVIVAPERADRPNALLAPQAAERGSPRTCPFCPGNERMTPPEVLAQRGTAGAWSLRVVPNRYPALRTEIQLARLAQGPFDQMAGTGAHEVVIETPDHERTLQELPAASIAQAMGVWQERLRDLSRDVRLQSGIVFKNHGQPAGATLFHAHSQIIALPFVPPELTLMLGNARAHFEKKERCLLCDLLQAELLAKSRIALETEQVVALAPYASRSPFELWLVPRAHGSAFESASGQVIESLAGALRTVLRKVDRALDKPAWNLFLHSMPLRAPPNDWFHWFVVLKPVLTLQAGFEWASGCALNPTPPEEAASFLAQTDEGGAT